MSTKTTTVITQNKKRPSRKERRNRQKQMQTKNKHQVTVFRERTKQRKDVKVHTAALAEGYTRKYRQPKMTTSKTGMVISHREYVGTVTASQDLTFVQLRINPADPVTFPWLSTIAGSYEKFKIRKMIIHYQKNCPTVQPGFVYMYPDYDVDRPPMSSETLFLNTMDVVETSPWASAKLVVKPSKLNQTKTYLIRSAYETYSSYLLYDPLNIFIGTAESLANDPSNIGRIFVEYEIELMIPDPGSQLKMYNLDAQLNTTLSVPFTDGFYNPNWFGGAPDYARGNLPLTFQITGFTFQDDFQGLMQLWFLGPGFDISRWPKLVLSGPPGSLVSRADTLVDTWGPSGGEDVWSQTWWVSASKGTIVTQGNGLSTSNNGNVQIFLEFASCNPRWLNAVDPKINGSLTRGLNLPPLPPSIREKPKKKEKKFKVVELSDSE